MVRNNLSNILRMLDTVISILSILGGDFQHTNDTVGLPTSHFLFLVHKKFRQTFANINMSSSWFIIVNRCGRMRTVVILGVDTFSLMLQRWHDAVFVKSSSKFHDNG